MARGAPSPTHRQLLLQADAERLGVVGFQLLQGHTRLPDELVVTEFVLIAHRDPGGQEARSALQTHGGGCSHFASNVSRDFGGAGGGVGGRARPCR